MAAALVAGGYQVDEEDLDRFPLHLFAQFARRVVLSVDGHHEAWSPPSRPRRGRLDQFTPSSPPPASRGSARGMKLRNLRRQVHRLENLPGDVLGLDAGDQAERDSALRAGGTS
jgi:hypothetical protein